MSYVGVGQLSLQKASGQVLSMKKVSRFAKMARLLSLPGVPHATCRVGHGAPNVTPWGVVLDVTKTVARWGAEPWIDKAVVKNCGWPKTCGGGPESGHSGGCIKSKYWKDDLFLAQKGEQSMYRVKERRVRALLRLLALPRWRFSSGLLAFAHDASFCAPVTVDWRLRWAARRALAVLDERYPDSRWYKRKGEVVVRCSNCTGRFSRWYDRSGRWDAEIKNRCLAAVVLAAPSYCFPGPTLRHYGSDVTIWDRYVPVLAAIRVQGSAIVPTAWFKTLLDCLVPGWSKPLTMKQMSKFAGRVTLLKM